MIRNHFIAVPFLIKLIEKGRWYMQELLDWMEYIEDVLWE